MRSHIKSWSFRFIKVAIAVIALWCVIWLPWKAEPQITWLDRGTLKAGTQLRAIKFLEPVPLWVWPNIEKNAPPHPTVGVMPAIFTDRPFRVVIDDKEQSVPLNDPRIYRAFRPEVAPDELPQTSSWKMIQWIHTWQVRGPGLAVPEEFLQSLPNDVEPEIILGIRTLILRTNPWLLVAAWAILGIPFLITAWRWKKLMEPQGIFLPYSKCVALTFVGQFYSILLPGVTGGDLVKIIYTSRVTGNKTKSMITVLLDRVIGLIALLVIAGTTAAFQAAGNVTMRNVALLIGAVLIALGLLSLVYFSHRLRQMTGLKWFLDHEIMPDFVRRADEVLHSYRHAWRILAEAFVASLIAQFILPISAWLAGMAFGMHQAHLGHYLAYVPLALVAASIPIFPPQGIGVYEWILTHFFSNKGLATASQAFALAQAIRFLPMLWNLVGVYWVITGSYSRHQPAPANDADLPLEKPLNAPGDSAPA